VSRIIYTPVCDYIRLFRFLPADILSVLISLGLVWAATDILAVLGFMFRVAVWLVCGADFCPRCSCVRARVYACVYARARARGIPGLI
jgi:hypothetical protein